MIFVLVICLFFPPTTPFAIAGLIILGLLSGSESNQKG